LLLGGTMNWASEEMAQVNLGDKRLNERVVTLLDTLGSKPDSSIPAKTKSKAEMAAAYRFFDNDRVDEQKILAPHYQCTRERMVREPVVLCVEDTTQIDYTTQGETDGLGPLYRSFQRGIFLHPMLAVTPDRECLGLLDAKFFVREIAEKGSPKQEKKKKKAQRAIEEKESFRWIDGYRRMNDIAKTTSSQLIYCADRESDIDELLTASQHQPGKLLIRACRDRLVGDEENEDEQERMWNTVWESPIKGHQEFEQAARPGHRARLVRQTIRFMSVTFPPNAKRDYPITINVIIAHEENPPAGEKAVSWTLLTTLDVTTLADALLIINYYRCRWEIELYFKTLKTGCAIEKLQLQTVERLTSAIALYMIIACRILGITKAGRATPDIPCDTLFEEDEWKTAYSYSTGKPPPKKAPRLLDIVIMIAKLGGFIGRKSDGFPGTKTLWIGLGEIRTYLHIHQLLSNIRQGGKLV
jgi:Transposase DNA-binding/Transposase Tn5 dimerisation domain